MIISGVALICVLSLHAQAQFSDSLSASRSSLPDSLPIEKNGSEWGTNGFADISFERFLNTYFWRAKLTHIQSIADWQISASENFTSNLADFLSTVNEKAARDENQFQAEAKKTLGKGWGINLQLSNFALSDSRSLFRNDALANSLAAGFSYAPSMGLLLNAMLGVKAEQQLGQPSSGWTYTLAGALDSLQFGNFLATASARVNEEFLTPRHNQTLNSSLLLRQNYGQFATIFLSGGFERMRRDFFSNIFTASASESFLATVERRTDQSIYTLDSLAYRIGDAWYGVARVELRYRTVTRENSQQFLDVTRNLYDNEITQQRLFALLGALYQSTSLNLALSVSYQQQLERYRPINASQNSAEAVRIERLRDNVLEVASISLGLQWRIKNHDEQTLNQLSVQYQMRGFRFDTPSPENNDDRDEVSYFLSISDSIRISEFLGLNLTASGAVSQNVFIFRQQSANSTNNFILRLSPSAVWKIGEGFRNYAEFGVLANYTVYPFESLLQVRSFSFRQFSMTDSAEVFLSKRFFIKFLYDQRIYERAELFWGEFAERPLNLFNDRLAHLELWLTTEALTAAFGVKSFWRQQFGFLGAGSVLQQEVLYIGPTARVQYRASYAELETSGWYQIEQINGTVERIIPNLTVAVRFSW